MFHFPLLKVTTYFRTGPKHSTLNIQRRKPEKKGAARWGLRHEATFTLSQPLSSRMTQAVEHGRVRPINRDGCVGGRIATSYVEPIGVRRLETERTAVRLGLQKPAQDRKSTRLNSSHVAL